MDLAHRIPAVAALLTRCVLLGGLVLGGLLLGGPLAPPAGAAVRAGGAAAGVWTAPLRPRPVLAAPFTAPAGPYAPGHRGADLRGVPGAAVLAAGGGVVAFAGVVAGRGVVSIDHPGGLRTTYEPVAASVRRGDPVEAGQPIGLLEGVGGHCPPQSCLHWGLRRGSTYLDPMTLLGEVRVRLLPLWGGAVPTPAPLPAGAWRAGPAAGAVGSPRRAASTGTGRTTRGGDGMPLVPAAVVTGAGVGAMVLLRRRVAVGNRASLPRAPPPSGVRSARR